MLCGGAFQCAGGMAAALAPEGDSAFESAARGACAICGAAIGRADAAPAPGGDSALIGTMEGVDGEDISLDGGRQADTATAGQAEAGSVEPVRPAGWAVPVVPLSMTVVRQRSVGGQ